METKNTNFALPSEASFIIEEYEKPKTTYKTHFLIDTESAFVDYIDSRIAYCTEASPCDVKLSIDVNLSEQQALIYDSNRISRMR